jgi:Putative serine esterase (DUF676)
MAQSDYPIIYVRGYAGSQSDVEETVDDPLYGFNAGSTHIRLDQDGHADFFMFVSPFARLFKDFGYVDVIDGALQRVANPKDPNKAKTVWIYRYYDPTSNTYDRPGGRRLSIEEAAKGLMLFVEFVKDQTKADKVYLIAHSMGGLVCRSLIQKIEHEKGTRPHRQAVHLWHAARRHPLCVGWGTDREATRFTRRQSVGRFRATAHV